MNPTPFDVGKVGRRNGSRISDGRYAYRFVNIRGFRIESVFYLVSMYPGGDQVPIKNISARRVAGWGGTTGRKIL